MTTTHGTAEFAGTADLTSRVSGLFRRYWSALQQRRKRAKLRSTLYGMTDRDLKDIGIAWSEIEHVALNGTDERADPVGRG
jgi:uncharacterized protein YjiS (DUF1127 family)